MDDLLSSFLTTGFGALFYYGIIIGVILFFIHISKKKPNTSSSTDTAKTKETANVDNSQNAILTVEAEEPEGKPAQKPEIKQKDPYGTPTVLLYVGSFLLISAIYLYVCNTNGDLVAPITIILTLLFYFGGLCIYKYVDYLKSVGKTFCFTALAVLAFWMIPLHAIGMGTQASWIASSVIALILYSVAAIATNSRAVSYFVYIWAIVFALSINPFTERILYWIGIAPMVVAFIPTALWLMKPSWLPVVFRKATKDMGNVLLPIIYAISLLLFAMPDIGKEFPYLRTIMSIIFVLFTLVQYTASHKRFQLIACRFAVQAMVIALVSDALNYSLLYSLSYYGRTSSMNEAPIIITAVVWLFSFLVQTGISIFIPKKDEKDNSMERIVEIISLVGIFSTIIIVPGLSETGSTIMQLIIYVTTAILGIIYSIYHRDSRWGFATIAGLTAISILLSSSSLITWGGAENLIYYAFFGAIVLAAYYFAKQCSLKNNESVAITGICVTGLALLISTASLDFIEIGWLLIAIYTAVFAFLSRMTWIYEVSIYSGALCIFGLIGSIGGAIDKHTTGSNVDCISSPHDYFYNYSYDYSERSCVQSESSILYVTSAIRAYVFPMALILASYIKEREKALDKRGRFIIAYIVLSLSLLVFGWSSGKSWMLFSLITQIGFLVYAALKDREWLIWTSIAVLLLSLLSLTGGFNYIWFGVIGLILILVVVWRLSKVHKEVKDKEDAEKLVVKESNNSNGAGTSNKSDSADTAKSDKADKE